MPLPIVCTAQFKDLADAARKLFEAVLRSHGKEAGVGPPLPSNARNPVLCRPPYDPLQLRPKNLPSPSLTRTPTSPLTRAVLSAAATVASLYALRAAIVWARTALRRQALSRIRDERGARAVSEIREFAALVEAKKLGIVQEAKVAKFIGGGFKVLQRSRE